MANPVGLAGLTTMGGLTVSVYCWLPVALLPSVAVMVKVKVPLVVGIPLRVPLFESVRPSSGPAVVKVKGLPAPPLAVMVWL